MKHERTGKCRLCGSMYGLFLYDYRSPIWNTMWEEGVCGKCATWMTREIDPEAEEYVIDGCVYRVYPYREDVKIGELLGQRGKTFFILRLSDCHVIKSNDVWVVGTPPPAFKTEDTAVFVPGIYHYPLCDGPSRCHGVTCLDRYTCALYIKELEEPDGPRNTIPKDWIDGDERCREYININSFKYLTEWRKKELLQRKE